MDRAWPTDGGGDPVPDANGNTECTDYEADPDLCGVYDLPAGSGLFLSVGAICCICGGGVASTADPASIMVDSAVAESNLATDLSTGMFTLGDQDLYVVYPTTEKALFDSFAGRLGGIEWPIAGNNTKSRVNECTKILGL